MKLYYPYLKIQKAISAIEEEISKKELSDEGPMSLKQLIKFKEILYEMRDTLNDNNELKSHDKVSSLGKIIADSWPLGSQLGEIIIQAEQEFNSKI